MLAVVAMPAQALVLNGFTPPSVDNYANELANPAAPLTGTYSFNVATNAGAFYPTGTNLIVGINLPAGVSFDLDVLPGNVAAGPYSVNVQGVSGQEDSTFVEFLLTVDNAAKVNSFTFNLPLKVAACPTSSVLQGGSLTANVTSNTVALEQGTVSEDGDSLVPNFCASALNGAVTSFGNSSTAAIAGNTDGTDTIILLAAGYTTLNNSVIGDVNYGFNGLRRAAGVPMDNTDVDAVSFDVVFEDDTAFRPTVANPGAGVFLAGNGMTRVAANTWRVIATGAFKDQLLDGNADQITVTATGAAVITDQQISVTGAVVNLNDNNEDFKGSEAGANGALDSLAREGAVYGPFDWNSEDGAVNSVYRVTGLPDADVPYTIEVTNSKGGKNGLYRGTIPQAAIINGETALKSKSHFGLGEGAMWDTSGDLANMTGFVKADVKYSFETSVTTIDVDRLISSANGFVANYGGGANGILGYPDARNTGGTTPNGSPVNDGDNTTE